MVNHEPILAHKESNHPSLSGRHECTEILDKEHDIIPQGLTEKIMVDQQHEHGKDTTQDVEKNSSDSTQNDDDSDIVFWDSPDDLSNPLNFSRMRKIWTLALISAITFVTPLASSMFAPGVPQLMREFKSSNTELAGFVVSIYILGFAVGPLVFAPLSELYGRLPVYHVCNAGFLAFTIGCALATNLNMLIGFRFLAGIFGSAPIVNGGGSIADIYVQEKRGTAMALFSMGPILGPVIGPLAGGYLSEAKGWRWVFWVISMVAGLFSILALIFMRETYAAVILERKTKNLRKTTGNLQLRSKLDSGLTPKDLFLRSIIRPAKMLVFSPIVFALSIYVGVIYGYLYLLFTTFTTVFEDTYHFSTGSVGLSFLGMGVGSITGLAFCGWISDRILKRRGAEADAKAEASGEPRQGLKPEYRLPPLLYGAAFIPAGLFIYGWTAHYRVHYIVPIMATSLIGFGNMVVFMVISMYLIDSYTIYAASALATNTVVRSIAGAVLPLAGQSMYATLGLGWGNSLLAFIACAMLPLPWVLMKWGEKLRNKYQVKNL